MKYDHIVVAYGKYYAAGEEVPEENPVKTIENAEELPFSDADIEFETTPTKRGRPKKTAE